MLPFKFKDPHTAHTTVGTLAIGPIIVIPTMYFMQYLSFEATVISLLWFSFLTLYVLGVLGTSLTTMSVISVLKRLDIKDMIDSGDGDSDYFEINLSDDPDAINKLKDELESIANRAKEIVEKNEDEDKED